MMHFVKQHGFSSGFCLYECGMRTRGRKEKKKPRNLLAHDGLPDHEAFLQVRFVRHEEEPLPRAVHSHKVSLLS